MTTMYLLLGFIVLISDFGPSAIRSFVGGLSLPLTFFIVFGAGHKVMCITCAKKMPTSPQIEINKKIKLLRRFHFLSNHPVIWAFLILFVVFVLAVVRVHVGSGETSLAMLAYPMIAFSMRATGAHRILQPWCPLCHWGDGGDEEQVPTPTPDPSISNLLNI